MAGKEEKQFVSPRAVEVKDSNEEHWTLCKSCDAACAVSAAVAFADNFVCGACTIRMDQQAPRGPVTVEGASVPLTEIDRETLAIHNLDMDIRDVSKVVSQASNASKILSEIVRRMKKHRDVLELTVLSKMLCEDITKAADDLRRMQRWCVRNLNLESHGRVLPESEAKALASRSFVDEGSGSRSVPQASASAAGAFAREIEARLGPGPRPRLVRPPYKAEVPKPVSAVFEAPMAAESTLAALTPANVVADPMNVPR